jgi:hypothetical protein
MNASSLSLFEMPNKARSICDRRQRNVTGNRLPVEHIYPDHVRTSAVTAERPFPYRAPRIPQTPGDLRVDKALEIFVVDFTKQFPEVMELA